MKAQQRTILVVDDNADDLLFIERALKSLDTNCSIHLLTSGKEAIAYLQGEGQFADREEFQFPGYILTDLKMPNGNGFDLLQFLQSNRDKCIIPVVMLTASGDDHDIVQAYKLGVSAYLTKPHKPDALRLLLKKMYDFFSECEVPQVTESGSARRTESTGKLRADPPIDH